MKVVLISPFSLGASSSRILYNLAVNLNIEKTFLLIREDKYGSSPKEGWFRYTLNRRNDKLYFFYVIKTLLLLRKENPEIIHFLKPHHLTLIPALVYAKLFKRKLVFECDDNEPDVLKAMGRGFLEVYISKILMNTAIKYSDAIVIPNEKMLSWIPEKFHEKTFYISSGADTRRFKPMPKEEDKFFRIVSVGNLHKIEPFTPLVDAVYYAVKLIPNLRCSIIGSGMEEKKLRDIIYEKGLSGFFELKGSFPHQKIPETLSNADALILPCPTTPGIQELGVKVFEYMAMEKPIIATSVGNIPKVLEEGKAGVLVPPDNPKAFAEAIKWVHDHPKEAAEKAAYARKLAVEKYDWKILSKMLLECYEKTTKS